MRNQSQEVSGPLEAVTETGQVTTSRGGPGKLSFYFDPICPWAWRTASWIHEVKRQLPIDVHWKFFSLAAQSGNNDPTLMVPLRVLALTRESAGNQGVERLYLTLGQLFHEETRDFRSRSAMERLVEEALDKAGFSRTLVSRAMSDPATEQKVRDEHEEARRDYGAYGVPWLVVDDCPFGFQGPVVQPPPKGDLAVELWRHVSWLLGQPYFYELKRSR